MTYYTIFSAMRAGARGYLLMGADPNEVLSVIRAFAEGQVLFGPAIAAGVLGYFKELNTNPKSNQTLARFPELTERELEVLRLISQGLNNQEITQKLSLSPKTVRNHITNIFIKLQVADRA